MIKLFRALIRKTIGEKLEKVFMHNDIALISYFYPQRRKIYALVKKIIEEKHALAKGHELYQIYQCVKSTAKIDGDLAEVGVWRGTTAKMICEAKGDKSLYLFDSFAGLPQPQKIDYQFKIGQYQSTLEEVKDYLKKYKRIFIYKGWFPQETGKYVKNKRFSLVHLDVDLYRSTKDALEFFYSKMNPGGIIISHDYVSPGIKKAFDDFFRSKSEPVCELPGIQCLVVKI